MLTAQVLNTFAQYSIWTIHVQKYPNGLSNSAIADIGVRLYTCSLYNLHRKALVIEWEALELEHYLEGNWTTISELARCLYSRTYHPKSVLDLTNALVTECNQILKTMLQHLGWSLSRRLRGCCCTLINIFRTNGEWACVYKLLDILYVCIRNGIRTLYLMQIQEFIFYTHAC